MASWRTLKLSPDPYCPSHTPPRLMLGNLTTWETGTVPSDRWEWEWAGQGPWKSKEHIYWGQCSQLGHRSSCLHWPKANKSGVKKEAISKHDWIKYIIPLSWVTMKATHWQKSINQGERQSERFCLDSHQNKASTAAKPGRQRSCLQNTSKETPLCSLPNPANIFWKSGVPTLRWGGQPHGGTGSVCRSILFDFPCYSLLPVPLPCKKRHPGWPAFS